MSNNNKKNYRYDCRNHFKTSYDEKKVIKPIIVINTIVKPIII